MKKKSLKMRLYTLGSVISGLLSLQVFVVIVLFVLSDLGASKSADIYPLDVYPTTAWWVYVVLAVAAIALFCFSIYLDDLSRKEEGKLLTLQFNNRNLSAEKMLSGDKYIPKVVIILIILISIIALCVFVSDFYQNKKFTGISFVVLWTWLGIAVFELVVVFKKSKSPPKPKFFSKEIIAATIIFGGAAIIDLLYLEKGFGVILFFCLFGWAGSLLVKFVSLWEIKKIKNSQ